MLAALLVCGSGLVPGLSGAEESGEELAREFGETGEFIYGATRWKPYHADSRTRLLLHFGKPEPIPTDELAPAGLKQRKERREERDLGEKLFGADPMKGAMEATPKKTLERKVRPPVKGPEVPRGTLYDYSWHRRKIRLKGLRGAKITPEGRFGPGIELDGSGPGLVVYDPDAVADDEVKGNRRGRYRMVELWVRPASLPDDGPVALYSAGTNEAQVLLHPDGRVELRRRHPYGNDTRGRKNYFKRVAGEESWKKAMEGSKQRDPTVISETRLKPGNWYHIAASRQETAVINAGIAAIFVNGEEEDRFQEPPFGNYRFWTPSPDQEGVRSRAAILGNDATGTKGFEGTFDELRLSSGQMHFGDPARYFNPRETHPWRDANASRPMRFAPPYFSKDTSLFHLSFEKGRRFDFHKAGLQKAVFERDVARPELLYRRGIRGRALTIDPRVTRLRIPMKGMSLRKGAVELWARPTNWDNSASGEPHKPHFDLSLLRMVVRHEETGELAIMRLPQKRVSEPGGPGDWHPGRWTHFMVTWTREDLEGFHLYRDVKRFGAKGRRLKSRAPDGRPRERTAYEPAFLELGVKKPAVAADGREPIILVDEIVGHKDVPTKLDRVQARKRVRGLEPLEPITGRVRYKYGIGEVMVELRSRIGRGPAPESATVRLIGPDGATVGKEVTATFEEKTFRAIVRRGPKLEPGEYTIVATVRDANGDYLVEEKRIGWTYEKAEWRDNDIGVLEQAPDPWTPVQVDGKRLRTRMTEYFLAHNGLPRRIVTKGENLLARPVQLLEAGEPMAARDLEISPSRNVRAQWSVKLVGDTANVRMRCRLEFDGMVRFELDVRPKADKVAPLRFEIPVEQAHGTHRMHQRVDTGQKMRVERAARGTFTSRDAYWQGKPGEKWRKSHPGGEKTGFARYDFWSQMDVTSFERGLYWFANHAGGWGQSEHAPAQAFRYADGAHTMVLNLVAERMPYESEKPIVFGILPHPARPLPDDYRLLGRRRSPRDEKAHSIFGTTFFPWPRPVKGEFKTFPRYSWEKAEKIGDSMRAMTSGYRVMYLSKAYFRNRAGAYDHWEWRNGTSSRISLAGTLIDYLMHEARGFLEHDVFDAIYLDDSYAWPVKPTDAAVKANQAIVLPDGTRQPGMRLWQFRELMKRYYGLFVQQGKRPMIMSHHTGHWMYSGMAFCMASLDGEGSPYVTVDRGRDFVEQMNLERFKVLSNPHLWGHVRFYMPSIWELGFQSKGQGTHEAWQWKMARGAQALLAHVENPTAFVDEGGMVYRNYWETVLDWGAGDPAVRFIPWHESGGYLDVEGQGDTTMASLYHKDGGETLLIVSNLEKKQRDIPIALDVEALGLGREPEIVLNEAGERPEGENPWKVQEETPEMDDPDAGPSLDGGGGLGGMQLESEETREKKRRAAFKPRLDGRKLTLPVRGHDFRLIGLE